MFGHIKRKYVSQSTTTIYYNCRRWRKAWAPEDGEKRVRKRLKPTRESIQCKAQLKAVWENGVVILSRVDISCDHLDSLEDADYAKRPSEFGRIAALYLQKGFSLAEVSHGVRALDDPILRQILQNIGGGHLTHTLQMLDALPQRTPGSSSLWSSRGSRAAKT